jgi:hypothetical protein
MSFLTLWIAQSFIGPTRWLHIPRGIWSNLIGFALIGVSGMALFIASLKEITAAVDNEIKYERKIKGLPEQSKACKGKVADMGSALYNMGLGSGLIIGPIIGGLLKQIGDKKQPGEPYNEEYSIEN